MHATVSHTVSVTPLDSQALQLSLEWLLWGFTVHFPSCPDTTGPRVSLHHFTWLLSMTCAAHNFFLEFHHSRLSLSPSVPSLAAAIGPDLCSISQQVLLLAMCLTAHILTHLVPEPYAPSLTYKRQEAMLTAPQYLLSWQLKTPRLQPLLTDTYPSCWMACKTLSSGVINLRWQHHHVQRF